MESETSTGDKLVTLKDFGVKLTEALKVARKNHPRLRRCSFPRFLGYIRHYNGDLGLDHFHREDSTAEGEADTHGGCLRKSLERCPSGKLTLPPDFRTACLRVIAQWAPDQVWVLQPENLQRAQRSFALGRKRNPKQPRNASEALEQTLAISRLSLHELRDLSTFREFIQQRRLALLEEESATHELASFELFRWLSLDDGLSTSEVDRDLKRAAVLDALGVRAAIRLNRPLMTRVESALKFLGASDRFVDSGVRVVARSRIVLDALVYHYADGSTDDQGRRAEPKALFDKYRDSLRFADECDDAHFAKLNAYGISASKRLLTVSAQGTLLREPKKTTRKQVNIFAETMRSYLGSMERLGPVIGSSVYSYTNALLRLGRAKEAATHEFWGLEKERVVPTIASARIHVARANALIAVKDIRAAEESLKLAAAQFTKIGHYDGLSAITRINGKILMGLV